MIKDILEHNESVQPTDRTLAKLHADFPQCFDKEGKFNIETFRRLVSVHADITRESYGLDFLGRSYASLISNTDTDTVIVPDEDNNAKPENAHSQNVYITSDNLDGLKHLLKSYAGEIKCIYIDPPYNTGEDDFVYSDRFKFTVNDLQDKLGLSEEKAARVLDLTTRSSSSHSAWLTFMAARLTLAYDLLSKDGVIFVSIDDNEQANLKLLLDSIFGEENFVTVFTKKGTGGRQDSKHYAIIHDYVLCYALNKELFVSGKNQKTNAKYPYYDTNKGRYYKTQLLRKWGDNSRRSDRPNLFYAIKDPNGNDFYPMLNVKEEGRWRWEEKTMRTNIDNGLVEFKKNSKGQLEAYEKIFAPENEESETKLFSTIIDNLESCPNSSPKELLGGDYFSYPKPVNLIKRICQLANTEANDIILDFFSGSGTTAHAVMQMNADDLSKENGEGGKRRFIMVQLDEATKPDSEARKAGYDTIDQIGMERIRRAAAKIRGENPLFADSLDLGFKHFTLKGVPQNTLDKIEDFDPHNPIAFEDTLNDFGTATVLKTWMVRDDHGFCAEPERITLSKAEAYKYKNHLYILSGENLDENAMAALVEQYGKDPHFPKAIVVFGYSLNYDQNAMLRANITRLQKDDNSVSLQIRY